MTTRIPKRLPARLLILATLAASGGAHAQYRGGINFRPALLNEATAQATSLFPFPFPQGFFIANTHLLDDGRARYGFRLGYSLSAGFALVGHYSEFDFREGALPASASLADHARRQRVGLDLAGTLPLSERLSVFGSAGVARFSGLRPGDAGFGAAAQSGLLVHPALRAQSVGRLGLGVQYHLSKSLGLSFEVERQRYFNFTGAGETDAENFALGVTFKF